MTNVELVVAQQRREHSEDVSDELPVWEAVARRRAQSPDEETHPPRVLVIE
jgi:hypothetical protein